MTTRLRTEDERILIWMGATLVIFAILAIVAAALTIIPMLR